MILNKNYTKLVESQIPKQVPQNISSAAEDVMDAYQSANKWLDIIKEVVYHDLSCVFFSNFIHNLAHSMPERFDEFGDILHTVDLKIPYPATRYISKEPKTIDEVFDSIFMCLDNIRGTLNIFIKLTDENYHGMSCSAEELLTDIEDEYPMIYRLQQEWKNSQNNMATFDKYVGQYVEHKDNLLEEYMKFRLNESELGVLARGPITIDKFMDTTRVYISTDGYRYPLHLSELKDDGQRHPEWFSNGKADKQPKALAFKQITITPEAIGIILEKEQFKSESSIGVTTDAGMGPRLAKIIFSFIEIKDTTNKTIHTLNNSEGLAVLDKLKDYSTVKDSQISDNGKALYLTVDKSNAQTEGLFDKGLFNKKNVKTNQKDKLRYSYNRIFGPTVDVIDSKTGRIKEHHPDYEWRFHQGLYSQSDWLDMMSDAEGKIDFDDKDPDDINFWND